MCIIMQQEQKIMRRGQVCVLLILSILSSLLLAACSAGENFDESEDVLTNWKTETNGKAQAVTNEVNSIVNTSIEDISLEDYPEYVFSTGEGQLLLVGEGFTLLDCNTLEIVKQNRNPGLDFNMNDLFSCKMTALEEEYILVGNWMGLGEAKAQGDGTFISVSEEKAELKLVRIGKDLQVVEALTMNDILGTERNISSFALAEHGTKLIFSEDYHGLYVYDRNTEERSECIDFYNSLEGTRDGGISSVDCIQYVESTGQILFTGSYFDSRKKEYLRTVGQVNMDGSGLSYEQESVYAYGDLWYFDGFTLIEDMEFRGPGGIGTAFYYDRNKELHVYSLSDEYTGLQPSEKGNYFAVQSVVWAEDGANIGYAVRIYASKNGQLIQEISLPRTEIGENTGLSECVICEDTERILMFLHDRETDDNVHIKVMNSSMQQ